MGYFIGVIFWGIIWGFATQAVIKNKGYEENWFWWGFFFSFIALIVAACKPENRPSYQIYTSDSDDPYSYFRNNSAGSIYSREVQAKQVLSQGGWTCTCGRLNNSYTGTCACGRTKSEVDGINRQKAERERAEQEKSSRQDELSNLSAIKELKSLLDEGIITQEEFYILERLRALWLEVDLNIFLL